MRLTRITLCLISAIIALGFCLLAVGFLDDVEPQTYQATEEMMVDTAELLAALAHQQGWSRQQAAQAHLSESFTAAHSRRFQAQIYEHLKQQVGLHLYITDASGMVVFDSNAGKRVGQDYSNMRDVAFTLAGRYGARSTRDDAHAPHTSVLYVAAPVGDPARPVGVLTVYKPQLDVLPLVRERERIIYTACLMIGTGILAWIAAVFLWLFRPIGKITEYARAVGRGERPPKPRIGSGREVNTLAHALDSMQDALEGRKYVERYLQTLTHEVKSPLAAIRGSAELLGEELPATTRKTFLNNLLAETSRCEKLVTRMLELSALENRKSLENPTCCDLRDIASQAAADGATHAETQAVRLTTLLPPAPVPVFGDPFLLRAAVFNLLENAIDFSPRDATVEITVRAEADAALVSVRDHGCGIPEFARGRVFERFFSLRHHHHRRKGTGLGLTLVRETAELHRGSVSLEPAHPGTVAILRLPAATATASFQAHG